MKKIYLLFFLLVSGFVFSQVNLSGKAVYTLKITGQVGADGSSCGDDITRGLQWIAYKDIKNSYKTLIQGSAAYPGNGHGLTDQSLESDIFYFTEDDKVTELFVRTTKRDRGNFGCKGVQYSDASLLVTTDYFYKYIDFSTLELNQSGNITIDIHPVINLTNPDINNNIIGTASSIVIPEMKGIDNKYFQWMYHIDGEQERIRVGLSWRWVDVWRSLPDEYQGVNSLNINCEDFLPFDAVGKKITLRANTYGTTVELLYAKSAPTIDSVDAQQTKCFDTNDGRAIIKFNSKLVAGETLTCSVSELDDLGNIKEVIYSTQDDETILIENNLTYEIPCNFTKGKYRIKLLGWYKEPDKKGANTYVMDSEHQKDFEIIPPLPLDFTFEAKNVQCYESHDGAITITPTGGTRDVLGNDYYSLDNGACWIAFPNNKSYTIYGLNPGTYKIKVKDMHGCIARIQTLVGEEIQLGEEKIIEAIIYQPLSPLTVNYTYRQNPTFFGAFNGKITASISGGTIKDDKSYDYKWIKTTGEEFVTTAQYNAIDNTYTISLENVPAGEYKLTVTDKNYVSAENKTSCSVIESSQILIQPQSIAITLTETQSISCNSENEDTDSDKFSDGILSAVVVGGIEPYQYVWSKYNDAVNAWDVLQDQTSKIAQNLSKGNYAVNIIDANGITQGIYNTIDLVTAIPAAKEIAEPAKLNLSFETGNISCYSGNNGWVKANVSGGMTPYNYTWYNVNGGIINNNEISQLTAGEYFVEVTDKKGCFIKGNIILTEPKLPVAVDYKEIVSPTFSGAGNGKIIAEVTGGTPNNDGTYIYEWKNAVGVLQTTTTELLDGKYIITLDGVPANDYLLTIKDKNYNEGSGQIENCSILNSKVTLKEPDPLKVTFEIIRSISCNSNNEFGNNKDTDPQDGQRDESQDGILIAHVTGGTPLAASANNGLPYYFYWKKQQADGSWMPLFNITGETASNLSHGNYVLNVKDRNGIMLGTYINNKLVEEIDVTQFMQEPPKLVVTITNGNVFCNGGNDGWATANVTGGTPPYDYKWSNETETDKNTILKAGEYWVFITDTKGCTTQENVAITEPKAPLTIKYSEVLNPSFYKATNGKIVVEVTGGTISANNSYWYEWKNSKGVIQTATTSFNNDIYTISLNGIPQETYTLNVHDANYDAATNKSSCNISNSIIILEEPDPLAVTFEIVRTISCNINNEFGNETDINPQDNQRDESQDGILAAHVKGGIQLQADKNNGLAYYYTWKKKQSDGSWKIWNDQDETIENISEGTYALNIEDANGIKLGTYTNNILVKETDAVQYIAQPAKLNLTFTKLNASCNNGDDGWAEAHVSGGTAPYSYEWTNGETTAKIENITTSNYFVLVTDAKGCVVQGSIFVGDPKGILTTETIKNPTCYKANDGSIQLNVTGGNLPYSYLWNTSATSKDLNNLKAGNYEVSITCPDCCVYKKRFVLKEPNPIIVNLGKDRTLCNDQVLDLDAAIEDANAQYSWTSTNGFTSNQPKVSITKAGTYHVKVTSGLGCIGEDEIIIKTSKAIISSEFLLSSQAYLDEEVILVNVSDPFGESTKWILPEGVKTIEQKEKYIILKFNEIGTYTVGLQQTQGECFAIYNKNIKVEKRSTLPNTGSSPKSIIDFIVRPNPSNGNFKAIVNLENNTAINLRLFSTTGKFTMQKKDSGKKKYEIDFNTSLQSGMYILVLETELQTLVRKIIIY
ncbi:T9SS type A sorting domain-containing protein [Flavobacterium sp. ANB]|uniref:T9SS type A sorting domain-containing protein n=1 Tax=unclassified Flavobacterium TaxID=196869 RepID=UPI0012B92CAA|nr:MULTISPECIES: T9SS type A sorting domain-containing protein [unclassified Flavobacterium]MBF4516515.1 T9SS type A sorting domain-containing protein [Flavobacterium sp. ANB]MTD69588.1 T9SS type A sorting domain-containing protein [Flavobacterium sp. LC2016-13]